MGKRTEKKGRGRKESGTHEKSITAKFFVPINKVPTEVCKKLFMTVYGISREKVDILIRKKKVNVVGNVIPDQRGKHIPSNKLL